MSSKITEKIRYRLLHIKDPFNIPLMIVVLDIAAKLFPNISRNESVIRKQDKEAVRSIGSDEPVLHETGLIDGRLNRSKILVGTTFFCNTENIKSCDYELIRDAGFDFLITGIAGEEREKMLDECLRNNIAVIGRDRNGGLPGNPDTNNITDDSVFDFSGYENHPALVGSLGWDEPSTVMFRAINTYSKAYRKALPSQFIFNNLFPDGTIKALMGAKNYREYIDKWAEVSEDDYISLDHYPFYSVSLINKIGFRIALNTYDCVAEACRRTGKDFWIYIQTQGNWFAHLYLLVTFEQIKWQIYTALCYGARSIIQVSYTPVWGNDAYAMTDKEGNLTEQYLYAKRINREIQKLSPVLSEYRSIGVLFAQAEKENRDMRFALKQQRKSSSRQGFHGIDAVRAVKSESTALVGYFENSESGKALMIVNCRDMFDSGASQNVTAELNAPYYVRIYQKGGLVSEGYKESIKICLDSCDGAFITLQS